MSKGIVSKGNVISAAFMAVGMILGLAGPAGAQINQGNPGNFTIIQPDYRQAPPSQQPNYPQPERMAPPPVIIPPPVQSQPPPQPAPPQRR